MNLTVINRTENYLLVSADNGDSEIMSNQEYETFLKNRESRDKRRWINR